MEPVTKKHRVNEDTAINVGDTVRLVNLPAFPGLEGLVADIVQIYNGTDVDVKLRKNNVIKRVCVLLVSALFIFLFLYR